jgi:hypothetical protein
VLITPLIYKDDSFLPPRWTQSGTVSTTGDELILGASSSATSVIQTSLRPPPSTVISIDTRARASGTSDTLTLGVLDTSNNIVFSSTYSLSSVYQFFHNSVSIGTQIAQIQLQSVNGCYVDFVAFEQSGSFDQGGSLFELQVNKKTVSLPIPNAHDVIQQLGITSRSVVITLPKVARTYYNTLENWCIANTPILLYTPTLQMPGFISDVSAEAEGGWVGIYDVQFTLIKTDSFVL